MSVYSRPIFDSAELLSTHCLRLKITVFWQLFCWRTKYPERVARLNNKLSPIHLPGRMSLKVSVYNLIPGLFKCFCALFIIVNLIVFVHFFHTCFLLFVLCLVASGWLERLHSEMTCNMLMTENIESNSNQWLTYSLTCWIDLKETKRNDFGK